MNDASKPIREKQDKQAEDQQQQQTAESLREAIKKRGGIPRT